MDRLGQSLLRDCLDHPGDPGRRLVYADWLSEQPWGEGHAALVRETAGWVWGTVYGEAPVWPGFWPRTPQRWFFALPASGGPALLIRFCPMPWPRGGGPTRQPWQWWLARGAGRLHGSAPSPGAARRRALRALLTCRRRGCACGR